MHITAILLEAHKRGKVSAELLLEILTEHVPTTCEACSEGIADFKPALGRARGGRAAEARDPVARLARRFAWGELQTQKKVKTTRSDVRQIVRLDQKTRLQTIRGANSRYLGPLFGALLLEEARRRIPAEPAEALALAEAALASSSRRTRRHEPDPEVQATALAVGGNAKRALGRLREGEVDLEKALELLHHPGLRDPALPAEVHSYLGSLRKDQGRFDEAERHLRLAGLLYEAFEEPEKAARVLLNLAGVQFRKRQFDAAVAAVDDALELLPADAEAWLFAYAHYNRAWYLHGRGDLDRAEAELAAHGDLFAGAGEHVALRVVWLRARIAWSRRDLKTAERLYTEARDRAMERGIAFDTSQVSLELALVHLHQGRTARVKRLALEALDVFSEQEVEREIHTALALLEAAARRDAITQELLQRTIDILERARHGRRAAGS
jgi:tetratricopeptide (TPR) repeat protein